jgi:hypothetical protein
MITSLPSPSLVRALKSDTPIHPHDFIWWATLPNPSAKRHRRPSIAQLDRIIALRGFRVRRRSETRFVVPSEAGRFISEHRDEVLRAIHPRRGVTQ